MGSGRNDTDAYNNNLIYSSDLNDDLFPYTYNGLALYSVSNTKGNPQLKPETITGWEIGAQLGFFDNRLGLDFTYYNKNSADLISSVAGFRCYWCKQSICESGEMTNKGFEVLLTGTPIKSESGLPGTFLLTSQKLTLKSLNYTKILPLTH